MNHNDAEEYKNLLIEERKIFVDTIDKLTLQISKLTTVIMMLSGTQTLSPFCMKAMIENIKHLSISDFLKYLIDPYKFTIEKFFTVTADGDITPLIYINAKYIIYMDTNNNIEKIDIGRFYMQFKDIYIQKLYELIIEHADHQDPMIISNDIDKKNFIKTMNKQVDNYMSDRTFIQSMKVLLPIYKAN
jgi:hypothetical protein